MKKNLLTLCLLVFSTLSFSQSSLDSLRMVLPVGHTGGDKSVNSFCLNSNGSYATSVGSKDVIIWDMKNGKELINCKGHTDYVLSVDYSSDNLKIVTSSWDKTIKIWDAKNGNLLQTLIGHEDHPDKVFFLKKDNNRVISICNSRGTNEVFVWDLVTEKIIFEFKGDIAVTNRNEDLLFVGNSSENIVNSYSLNSGQKINDYYGLSGEDIQYCGFKSIIYSLSVNQSDKRLLAAGGDGVPIIWDIKTAKQLFKLEGHNCRIFAAGFSSNKKYIYTSGDDDGTFKIWKANGGKLLFQHTDKLASSIRSAIFSSDDKYFAYVSLDSVQIFQMKNFKKIIKIPIKGVTDSKICVTKNPKIFAVSCDKSVNFYDFESGKLIKELKGHSVNSSLNSFGLQNIESSLENYIAGNNFIFKIEAPESIQFHNYRLINISAEGKTAWILKDKNEVFEVSLPSFEKINSISLNLPNEILSNESLVNIQSSEKYIFLEYKDSIFIHNKSNNQLVVKIAGGNLVLSNDPDLIGLTTDNMLEANAIMIYSIESNDTLLFYGQKNDYYTSLQFSPDSKYFLSLSIYGAYSSYSNIFDIEKKNIIDTIGIQIPNATFTNLHNFILYTNELNFDNRNYPISNIRDFVTHQDIGSIKGENPRLDWKKKYYSTISNDTISLYYEKDFLHKKSFVGHMGIITNILFNSGINKLVSVGLDNQIIVWDFEKDCEVYKLIILENNNYLVKLPNSPYYMCSKDASKMLHYVTPSLKVIGFEQLDPVYNRPDIVLDSIGKYFGGTDKQLVVIYGQLWEKRINRLGLDKEKLGKGEIAVPNAEIVGADAIQYENKNGKLEINVSAYDPKYILNRFNVYVNEVPIYGSAGISIAPLKKQIWDTTLSVPLSLGENKIQVSVMNELGLENFKYPTYVNYTPANNKIVSKTFYIGIGVNEFKDSYHNLKYCVKDVTDLAKEFRGKNTRIKLITNENVNRENILKLKKYLIDSTTVNDKVIISCSSHGLLDDSLNFYLATSDIDFKNPKENGIKYEEIENLLDSIPARQKLLLLDACNSGENDKTEVLKHELQQKKETMNNNQIIAARGFIIEIEEENKNNFKKMNELFVNVRNNTGSVIISAAGGKESALESIEVNGKQIENGAFTYSILECLKQNKDKVLKVNALKQYAETRVEEITNGKQNPTSRQETMEIDWLVK